MPKLRDIRDYNESFVINHFKWSGSFPTNNGTFVKIGGSGFMPSSTDLDLLGSVGASFDGVISERWGVNSYVSQVTATGDYVLGMLLYDQKETDENGEKLIFRDRKRREMNVSLSGEATPVVTKGFFWYSGVSGTVTAGAPLYANVNGELSQTLVQPHLQVGKALSGKDGNGWVYIQLDV